MLVYGMALWVVMAVMTNTIGSLLKAVDEIKLLACLYGAMAVINVPTSIFLIRRIGEAGAIWGTVISFALCLVLPMIFMLPGIFSRLAK